MYAQSPSISPQVINSAGDNRQVGTSNIYITDNIGEPFTETIGTGGSNIITQGFIQPDVISNLGFVLTSAVKNLSCFQKDDGEIKLTITPPASVSTFTANYQWTPASICPNNDCKDLINLKASTYSVKVTVTYSNSVGVLKADTLFSAPMVVADEGLPCNVTAFSGISANGDGVNDVFIIKNIEEYPKNKVLIYNRWGKLLAEINGYNNTNNVWPAIDKLDNLLSTTYFYLIDLGDGSKLIKGWVELMKN